METGLGRTAEVTNRRLVPVSQHVSKVMRGNKRVDTRPEIDLRKELHRSGYRYRKHFRIRLDELDVRPDIVFTARKVAVFVDGCFWHVCPQHGPQPTTNEWYWTPKLGRNVKRDQAVNAALRRSGWRVVRLWEHEPLQAAVTTVENALRDTEHVFDARREG